MLVSHQVLRSRLLYRLVCGQVFFQISNGFDGFIRHWLGTLHPLEPVLPNLQLDLYTTGKSNYETDARTINQSNNC